MNSHIDLDFKTNYKVWCYLQRKHIECDNTPIVNGVAVWPVDGFANNLKTTQWRLSYEDTADGTVKRTIDKLLNMIDNGLEYCPFCGGIATIDRCSVTTDEADEIVTWTSYTVECLECGCKTAPGCTERDAIDAWNRRA